MPFDLARHDLVRVEPAAFAEYAAALAAASSREAEPVASGWVAAGRPLIVRRFAPGEGRSRVPLGLPLPRSVAGPRRIAITLAPDGLVACAPPTLADVRAAAPEPWHTTLDALIALGARHGVLPRPFGSLLWQAVTGLAYLAPGSDLDALWPLAAEVEPGRLRLLLDGIAAVAETAPMRLDGEILLPDGFGVQWRELRETPDGGAVLVKHRDRIAMRAVIPFRCDGGGALGAGSRP